MKSVLQARAGKIPAQSYNHKIWRGTPGKRMAMRWGAGVETLVTRYELFGRSSKPLLKKNNETSSSRGWRRCARKLNQDTELAVTARLNKIK